MKYSEETVRQIKELYTFVKENSAVYKLKEIENASSYSNEINRFIRSISELEVYKELGLKESFITRPALIYNIDPEFYIVPGTNNIDRMKNGKAPYDAKSGKPISLHHIGQQYNSPFAEIPQPYHASNKYYSILHESSLESWRWNKEYVTNTNSEIQKYWKLRSEMIKC